MKRLIPAAMLLAAACGSSPSGSETIQNGSWSGSTFDSTAVSFTVNDNQIQNMTFEITYELLSQPDTTLTWSFNTEISDNEFQYEDISGEDDWEFGVNMNGTFDPPHHVTGELTTWVVCTEGGGTETDTLETSWSATAQ